MTETGNDCPTSNCWGDGYEEYGGLCPACWVRLSEPGRQAILSARQPGVPVTEVHEHHAHVYARPKIISVVVFGILCGVAGAAAVLAGFVWMVAR